MKKLLLVALVLALFLYGAITTQAALVNVNWVYDTVANTLKPVQNAINARIMGSVFTGASTTESSTFANLNNVLYADQFPGVDMGAKINNAYASLPSGGGQIVVTASSTFSTPINFNTAGKFVNLKCNPNVQLTYTGTGTSTTFNTNAYTPGYPSQSGMEGCRLRGPGYWLTGTVGIQLGGSNGAANVNIENNHFSYFYTGMYTGANTYVINVDKNIFINNTQNLSIATANNSGENMRFTNNLFADTDVVTQCIYLAPYAVASAQFTNNSYDNCQIYIDAENLNVNINGGHFENPGAPGGWVGRYPYIYIEDAFVSTVNVSGAAFVDTATTSITSPSPYIRNGAYLSLRDVSVDSNNDFSAASFVQNSTFGVLNVYGFNEVGSAIDVISTSTTQGIISGDSDFIGIGTSSPLTKLHVWRNGTSFVTIDESGSNPAGVAIADSGSNKWVIANRPGAGNALYFAASPADFSGGTLSTASKLTITQAGNVTIPGTTTLATTTVTDFTISRGLRDTSASLGTSGMVLQTTGTSSRWVATSTLGISGGGGSTSWGSITGTLSSQTDLQTALDAKLNLTGGTLTGDFTAPTTTLATTTISRLTIGSLTGLLKGTSGLVSVATPGTDYVANATGDWTGTFDGQEGSYYLNAGNLTGTVASARLSGAYTGITGLGTLTALTVTGTSAFATTTAASSTIGTLNLTNALALGMGGTGATTASGARTNLGATTIGSNIFTLTNPSSSTLLRLNADNTVSAISTSSLNLDLANTVGTLGATRGGTGLTSYSTGDLIYASGANTLTNRTIGSTGNVLSVVGGVPTWVATSTLGLGGGGGGFSDPLTTDGDIIARISGATTRLAQGSNGTYLGVSGGVLGYYTPAGSGTINSGNTGEMAFYTATGTAVSGNSSIIASTTSTDRLKVTGSSGGGFGYITHVIENTNSGGRASISFATDDSPFAGFVAMAGSGTTNTPRDFDIGTNQYGNFNIWTNDLRRLIISRRGDMMLGTTTENPYEKLTIQASSSNSGANVLSMYDSTGAQKSGITNNGTYLSDGGYRTPYYGVGYAITSGYATTSSIIMDFFASSNQAVMRGYESNGIGFRTGAGTPLERMRILQDGRVGIGTTTATGTLAVQSSYLGQVIASFFANTGSTSVQIGQATSSVTHNSTLSGFAQEILARITIGIDSVVGYYRSGKLFGALTISGLFYQEAWNQTDCSQLVGAVAIAADGMTGCDGFSFYEDGTETLTSTTEGGNVFARLSTSLTNGGAGVFANAPSTGAFIFGTSTPKLEVTARMHTVQNWATSTKAYIGFTNLATAGAAYEIEPTVGCYFMASSTVANWQAVCRTSAAVQTVVDTGVATTTTTGTGNSRPRRFFIEADSLEARFYIQSSEAGNLTQVAGITTTYPSTNALNAGVHFGSPTGVAARGIDVYDMNFGWRKVLR